MNRLRYYIVEGFRSIGSHGLNSFATICVIFACLLLMATFGTVAVNVNSIVAGLEDEIQMLAFVDESYSEQDARSLERQLLQIDNVDHVVFKTRQEAMDEYLADLEYSELFEDVESDTFRDRYLIYMKDVELMAGTQVDVAAVPGIALVTAHLAIGRGMVAVRRIVNIVSIALIVLLFLISIVMMSNTLRLAATSRRNEVAIIRMMGATNRFIRGPFTVEGVILGLAGSACAFIAEWAVYGALCSRIEDSALSWMQVIPFNVLALPLLIAFFVVGVAVAVFGSRLTIRNYMRV